ncbi:putative bifunctional diguanylate cyclase/phosphodiesterase [Mangrovihabitans endophyticus]|uniref:PAS domain S-box-containing protein/diguanylate cyclase (GGDEF) domain-containing protein n=1 Tax=Mangrovihabitans endophyticus TaxID=1751298 RepID=A0A8J3FQG6_9ACTN|nr:EAL domain-containing protein [Mangrovihabitans endophyticus]GGK98294.1 hypothetical protein GCM10012284_35650 [Mangrovihabitans endophyticus]
MTDPLLRGDRLLRIAGWLAVACVAWFLAAMLSGVDGPIVILWAVTPVCAAITAALCMRTGRDPAVQPAARRFWRRAGVVHVVFALALATHVAESLNADLSMTSRLTVYSGLPQAVGLLLLVWSLLALPIERATRSRQIALALDCAILVAGTATFFLYFAGVEVFTQARTGNVGDIAWVAFMVVGLVGVLAVAKVAVTGSSVLSPDALRVLGAALAVGGFSSAMAEPLLVRPELDVALFAVPVGGFAIGLAARLQAVAAAHGRVGSGKRYSVLPYLVAAAVGALLVHAIRWGSDDLFPVAVAAVTVTGLVVLRQVIAFWENDRLFAQVAREEERFRSLVQNATDVVTITDPGGRIRYVSPAVHRVLGIEPELMRDTTIAHRLHPDDRAMVAERVAAVCAAPGTTETYRARLMHADGSYRWLEIISANMLEVPSIAGVVSNSRDITETVQVQERLSYEATHDALTGLANRTLFADRVNAAIGDAAADPRGSTAADPRVSVVLVDLDDFKHVNDNLGHRAGDALLTTVAERMRNSLRLADTVARLGGDEFAILLAEVEPSEIDRVLDRLAGRLAEPVVIEGHLLSVRASFGVADGCRDAGDLLRRADIAMYEAKQAGGGTFRRYHAGMTARGAERNELAAALRTAIVEEQLVLHYQPVVTLPEGRITGVEALVRWQHPERGLLGPGAFVAAAEQTGVIVGMGRWVLRTAVRQMAAWIAEYGVAAPATVSVNASPRQLQESSFADDVAAALRDHDVPAQRLTVEVTESTAVGGGATQDNLRALRAMGVRLSLDDFGTGASTLSLLADLQVDQIKLDRSFVPVPGPDAIAAAVVQLAAAFGIEAVAEGVEEARQAARLTEMGYRRAQGYHFARPMPATEVSARLSAPPVTAAVS